MATCLRMSRATSGDTSPSRRSPLEAALGASEPMAMLNDEIPVRAGTMNEVAQSCLLERHLRERPPILVSNDDASFVDRTILRDDLSRPARRFLFGFCEIS